MVEIFWITNKDYYASLRNLLEKGSREEIRILSYSKLIEFKDDLPSFSVLCFEVDDEFSQFITKHELSLEDQLIIPICSKENEKVLVKTSEELKNKNRMHLTLDPNGNEYINMQNFRTVLKLSTLSRGAKEFSQVGKNINKLVVSSLSEVERLRKLHERLVSLRSESIKGIKVTSKFSSGEAPGGDFFDMIVGEAQMLILLSSTNSYVTTSVLLTHIEMLRNLKSFSEKDISAYLSAIHADIDETIELDIMFAIIDNRNLNMKVFNFGNINILGFDKIVCGENELKVSNNSLKQSLTEFTLERDTKLFILSPGIFKMTAGIVNNSPLNEFLKGQKDKEGTEVLNELFFHLKKNSESMFLKRDASALVIEVGSNVIVEV